jgi:hypothetical protein
LHDDCIAGQSLLVPAGIARVGQVKDLTTYHFSQEAQARGQPSAPG